MPRRQLRISLGENNRLFSEERERLEKWAEDMVAAAEKDLADTKAQIKAVRRQCHLATTLDEQNELQQNWLHWRRNNESKRSRFSRSRIRLPKSGMP